MKKIIKILGIIAIIAAAGFLVLSCDESECEHEWGIWSEPNPAPTGMKEGEHYRLCVLCDEKETEELDRLPLPDLLYGKWTDNVTPLSDSQYAVIKAASFELFDSDEDDLLFKFNITMWESAAASGTIAYPSGYKFYGVSATIEDDIFAPSTSNFEIYLDPNSESFMIKRVGYTLGPRVFFLEDFEILP